MYKVKMLNNISQTGLALFDKNSYNVAEEIDNPDGILVRSTMMHDMELPVSLQGVARAGAGVNNIPIDKCSEKGIVVFNTPGANANAVKELTIAALLLSSRKIIEGIQWVKSLEGQEEDITKIIEKEKARFAGPEIEGKKLGVIGLGAIGVMVANAAKSLGMEVEGFDPYISVDAAWGLSRSVKKASDLRSLLENCDYITLHIPLTDETKHFINSEKLSYIKKGVRMLNFSRGELVNNDNLKDAIQSGSVSTYITDFPDEDLLGLENVIAIPHMGASTMESEENCAVMAVKQLIDFLENGNISHSVNFPTCELNRSTEHRITVAHKNIPNMVAQISTALSKMNIANMVNKSKGNLAYTILEIEDSAPKELIAKLEQIEGILKIRVI